MTSSFDNIKIVVNPDSKYFKTILKEMNEVQGWSFTEYDYDTWLSTYHKFWFFIALEKDTNKPVAAVALGLDEHSAVSGEPLYSIGMYYCSPEYRGTGLGMKVWDTMFAVPEKGANIVLHGAIDMGLKYAAKYGFCLIPGRNVVTTFKCEDVVSQLEMPEGIITKDVTTVHFADVDKYENTVNPRPHPKFLRKWMMNVDAYSRIAYNSSGTPIGICCIRADIGCELACGPFYAESPEAAVSLLWDTLAMIDLTNYKLVRFIYTEGNKEVDGVVGQITPGKFESGKKGYLQFTKKVIDIPGEKVYSISDCAMGVL